MTAVDGYNIEPIIGLEIHVQLATRTKLWCSCALEFGAEPNSRVCPVCLGLPGALPVLNARAVDLALQTALALNCRVASFTKWDRKSYYYPDLPKNYQISQYDLPIAQDGWFEFPLEGELRRAQIIRAHLEEDAGKNVHDLPGGTGIDLNRAGTPLLEIVTAPDVRSADEAREFAVQLHRLVRYLGVAEANMQKGQMRFEPNVNLRIIRPDGPEARTPIVEVKNLNSFRALHGAISHEVSRQFSEWLETGVVAAVGNKSNRGWDDVREITVPQREKEEADDYRYFPDPDLPPLTVTDETIRQLRAGLPELPVARTERMIGEFELPARDAPALLDDRSTADLLDAAGAAGGARPTLGKHFLSFWSRLANERGTTIAGLGIAPRTIADLARLAADGKVNATAAATVAEHLVSEAGAVPMELAERLGLIQSSDESQIRAWVDQVLASNPKAIQDLQKNPKKRKAVQGFLSGQVMRLSQGRADPRVAGEIMQEKLAELCPESG